MVTELDKSRSSSKKPALGGSLFSSSSSGPSAPPEIQPLVSLQIALSKASATTSSAVPSADSEYDRLTDSSKSVPTPPVYAARLSALLKSLASAESAVSASLKARHALVEGLEKLVETNKAAIIAEENQQATLSTRKTAIEGKKREVEDGIMRGIAGGEQSPVSPIADPRINGRASGTPATPVDPDRPDIEELTPPPPDNPVKTESDPATDPVSNGMRPITPQSQQQLLPVPSTPQTPAIVPTPPLQAGADLLSSLNVPAVRQYSGSPSGGGAVKKRKLDDEAAVFGNGEDAMAGLDDDVAELLRQESAGR